LSPLYFAGGAAGRQIVLATRRQGWRGFVGRANGGMIVHLGVVLIAVALAASQSYIKQQELTLGIGETGTVAGHTVTYRGLETVAEKQKTTTKALVQVDGGQNYAPAVSTYPFGSQTIATPSVRSTLRDDVALSLPSGIPADPNGPIVLRVVVQPLIVWLWIGGAVMAFGTVLAAFPGRRRRGTEPTSAPVAALVDPEPDAEPALAGTS